MSEIAKSLSVLQTGIFALAETNRQSNDIIGKNEDKELRKMEEL